MPRIGQALQAAPEVMLELAVVLELGFRAASWCERCLLITFKLIHVPPPGFANYLGLILHHMTSCGSHPQKISFAHIGTPEDISTPLDSPSSAREPCIPGTAPSGSTGCAVQPGLALGWVMPPMRVCGAELLACVHGPWEEVGGAQVSNAQAATCIPCVPAGVLEQTWPNHRNLAWGGIHAGHVQPWSGVRLFLTHHLATVPHLDLEVAQAVQGDGLAVAALGGQLPSGRQEGCAVLPGEAPLQQPVKVLSEQRCLLWDAGCLTRPDATRIPDSLVRHPAGKPQRQAAHLGAGLVPGLVSS